MESLHEHYLKNLNFLSKQKKSWKSNSTKRISRPFDKIQLALVFQNTRKLLKQYAHKFESQRIFNHIVSFNFITKINAWKRNFRLIVKVIAIIELMRWFSYSRSNYILCSI